jgi:hypothetical protein
MTLPWRCPTTPTVDRPAIGLVVALSAGLSPRPCGPSADRKSVDGLPRWRPRRRQTANIPQPGDGARLALIVEEAVVQDGYMNALTDGFGGA